MSRVLLVLVAFAVSAFSQAVSTRVRVAGEFMYSLAERKVLPDIADLKGRELTAEVAVEVVVSKTGSVTKARAFKGDPGLFKRSQEPALRWHYKPYLMVGEPVEVDTTLEFRFTKDKVEIVVPPPRP
jgi:TonB-like protein